MSGRPANLDAVGTRYGSRNPLKSTSPRLICSELRKVLVIFEFEAEFK